MISIVHVMMYASVKHAVLDAAGNSSESSKITEQLCKQCFVILLRSWQL